MIEHCTIEASKNKVVEDIIDNIGKLSKDEYGNYVVQHVAEYGSVDQRAKVCLIFVKFEI